jgi:hypothetical protein
VSDRDRDRTPIRLLPLLMLAGCAPAVVAGPPIISTGSGIVLAIQARVQQECRFRVDADTVGSILTSTYPATDVSSAICLAVLQSRGDPSIPRVNGVAIRGRWGR